MKSFFISAGLVAVGTAGLQSALADGSITTASPKIWSVSATLRGFYDDNYATAPNKKGSYGIELTPSVALNESLQQTDIGIRYTYGLYWYQERQILGQDAIDQTHQLDLWLDHSFNEQWKVTVSDTFVDGQEPELINAGVPFRVSGDNLANHFNAALNTQWTREFSTLLHYENDFYDFQNSGASVVGGAIVNGPSLAGLLNRDEQDGGLDLQWHFNPETMAFVGYTLSWVDYTGQEPIAITTRGPENSDYRNSISHQVYVGLQHQITANLSGVAKVGAQYNDSYNAASDKESWSPYANLSLSYTYLPGDYLQVGFTQDDNSTYVAQPSTSNGSLTQYQETSTVYANINHHITEKLIASAIAQYSYSEFHGGENFTPDVVYSAGLNLTYIINQFLSADIGYNYDHLRSSVPGAAYERNRYYIGLTATY